MAKKLFGTDGARGVAITELTCELVMQIGRASAIILTKHSQVTPTVLIGKDTRISSDILENALIAGLCSVGANVEILGVIPTPAVATLIKKKSQEIGENSCYAIMISASHNSFEFNGIKLFSGTGYKLPDEIEDEIEELIFSGNIEVCEGEKVGTVSVYKNAVTDYIRHIKEETNANLGGLKIALDCACGSASVTAESLFTQLGAEVFITANTPNGLNINDGCGSTYIENIAKFTVANKCQIGIAFDGDADRCLAVDENGNLIDGDKIIAIIAKSYKEKNLLKKNSVVVTPMTNLGFMKFAKNEGINVISAKVGDRYVLEQMLEKDYNIGGEQSGHIIFLDNTTTGDGQLSAVKLLEVMKESGKKASEIAEIMTVYPQVLKNIKVLPEIKENWQDNKHSQKIIKNIEEKLGDNGRVLVRASGTEPLIRVMLEGENLEEITAYAEEIIKAIIK